LKFLSNENDAEAYVEIGKESNHHKNGEDVFMAEVKLVSSGKEFYVKNYNAELYAAIDAVRDEMLREIKNNKEKNQTLFIRGARKIKKRIKGMKPWWPFGGKSE
jgi:ribosome-associated translation inhibitor RaiA